MGSEGRCAASRTRRRTNRPAGARILLLVLAGCLSACASSPRTVHGVTVDAWHAIPIADDDVEALAAVAVELGLDPPHEVDSHYTRYPLPCPTVVIRGPEIDQGSGRMVQRSLRAKRTDWEWCEEPEGEVRSVPGWDVENHISTNEWLRVRVRRKSLDVSRADAVTDAEAIRMAEAVLTRSVDYTAGRGLELRRRFARIRREARERGRLYIGVEQWAADGSQPVIDEPGVPMLTIQSPGLRGTVIYARVEGDRVVLYWSSRWVV